PAQAQIATAVSEVERITSVFDSIGGKLDAALTLRDQLERFLDVDKPFQVIRNDADTLRSHVDGTGEMIARLREQHDRLMDAHKLATSKMEALDRRRDDLSRSMQDKERRVAG